MTEINMLIADDHSMIRGGLIALLEHQERFKANITEAVNGKEALQLATSNHFDLILLDITMPEMDGITVLKKLKELGCEIPVLVMSMHNERTIIRQALEAGAYGYLLKNTGLEELTKAIFTVVRKQKYYSNEVTQVLFNDGKAPTKSDIHFEHNLSKREVEVLELIVKEYTSQDIADKLFISKRTVEGHRKKIMSKLGIKTSIGLVKFALENNFS
jgi:DNA-binding NarL/FixJ family response regulator